LRQASFERKRAGKAGAQDPHHETACEGDPSESVTICNRLKPCWIKACGTIARNLDYFLAEINPRGRFTPSTNRTK
jgi:hypothetical protein